MAITLQALMDMFYRKNPEIVKHEPYRVRKDTEVKGIRFMALSGDQMQEGYLYLAPEKQSDLGTPKRDRIRALYFFDGTEEECGSFSCDTGDISCIFNAFCAAFDSLSKWEREVDLALAKGEPLQHILNLSADMIGLPLLVYNPSMKLLGHINEKVENNPWFHDIIQRGYLIQDIFANLSSHHIFEDLEKNGEAFLSAEDQESGTYTKINLLRSEEETLGYVFLISFDSEMVNFYSGLFQMLCDKIQLSLEQELGALSLRQDYLYEYILTDILNGNLTDPEDISIRLRYIDVPEAKHYVLLNLCFREDTRIPLGYFASTMKSVLRESYFFHYGEQPYVILHLQKDDGDEEREEKLLVLVSILRQFDCMAIAGESFEDLTQLPSVRSQTDIVGWLFKRDLVTPCPGNVIKVEDCRMEQMMLLCLNLAPAEAWIHPAIKKITQDDLNRNMKYIDFLNAYREENCEVGRTAERLFMHRSNVAYHLGKVKERYGIDAADSEQCFDMVWSLRLLEFAEKLKKD